MIFISYSWQDSSYAHQCANNLLHMRRNVWIDIWNLNLNKEIKEQIESAIVKSYSLILIDSPSSRSSEWVKFEVNCAKKNNIPIFNMPINC